MKKLFYKLSLKLFDTVNANTTTQTGTGQDLSAEMKTYYSDYLIDNATPKLIHDQFAQKHNIPANGGKTIEFRKYSPLAKALTPLTEGVTPTGTKMDTSVITATVKQYGAFIGITDMLQLTAIDNNMLQATKLCGNQAGETLDTITREVMNGGTNVMYSGGKTARHLLVGGEASGNSLLSVLDVKKAVRYLKAQKAQKIDGYYIGIINQDAAFDIMNDPDWVRASEYAGSTQIFEGEIGRIAGARFVETTEAKIFHAENLTAAARNLTVKTQVTTNASVPVKEAISSAEAAALAGREIIVDGKVLKIESATQGSAGSASLTLTATATISQDVVIYPAGAGAKGRDVYSTLFLGDNAYGTTEVKGGGLEHIVKQLGSGGTSDPLNQRATVGWKALKTAVRLVEQFMVRVESCSTFESGAN